LNVTFIDRTSGARRTRPAHCALDGRADPGGKVSKRPALGTVVVLETMVVVVVVVAGGPAVVVVVVDVVEVVDTVVTSKVVAVSFQWDRVPQPELNTPTFTTYRPDAAFVANVHVAANERAAPAVNR